jgi:hypothetical protein
MPHDEDNSSPSPGRGRAGATRTDASERAAPPTAGKAARVPANGLVLIDIAGQKT